MDYSVNGPISLFVLLHLDSSVDFRIVFIILIWNIHILYPAFMSFSHISMCIFLGNLINVNIFQSITKKKLKDKKKERIVSNIEINIRMYRI